LLALSSRRWLEGCSQNKEETQYEHHKDLELPFEVAACQVDHSIFVAVVYILRGNTTVAHTGDFRLHSKQGAATRKFVMAAKDASVLIIEGMRANSKSSVEKVRQEPVRFIYDNNHRR
jgi:ribonuclease J